MEQLPETEEHLVAVGEIVARLSMRAGYKPVAAYQQTIPEYVELTLLVAEAVPEEGYPRTPANSMSISGRKAVLVLRDLLETAETTIEGWDEQKRLRELREAGTTETSVAKEPETTSSDLAGEIPDEGVEIKPPGDFSLRGIVMYDGRVLLAIEHPNGERQLAQLGVQVRRRLAKWLLGTLPDKGDGEDDGV